MRIYVTGGEMSFEEKAAYARYAENRYKDKHIDSIDIKIIDDDYVDLWVHFAHIPFDRIRRITGYLVGTLDRFNNAKRAEVADRVKHGI